MDLVGKFLTKTDRGQLQAGEINTVRRRHVVLCVLCLSESESNMNCVPWCYRHV